VLAIFVVLVDLVEQNVIEVAALLLRRLLLRRFLVARVVLVLVHPGGRRWLWMSTAAGADFFLVEQVDESRRLVPVIVVSRPVERVPCSRPPARQALKRRFRLAYERLVVYRLVAAGLGLFFRYGGGRLLTGRRGRPGGRLTGQRSFLRQHHCLLRRHTAAAVVIVLLLLFGRAFDAVLVRGHLLHLFQRSSPFLVRERLIHG